MIDTHAIRILLVDDSAAVLSIWNQLIKQQSDMQVVGTAHDGNEALQVLQSTPADVILLDIEMPNMDGLTLLPLVRQQYPHIKVLMVSSLTTRGAEATVRSLVLGAADYVTKPATGDDIHKVYSLLLDKIRAIARKHDASAPRTPPALPHTGRPRPSAALVVGSSTGGPNALVDFFRGLPASYTLPIFLVQHMPTNFIPALADRIAKDTGRTCCVATHGDIARRHTIYLAPGDMHLELSGTPQATVLRLTNGPEENYCKPAVDPLFRSAAAVFGSRLVAVVLTGMGEDGCQGAMAVANAGGTVLAQDEASSVVWGMPGAVAAAGIARHLAPPAELAHMVGDFAKG